MHEYHLIKKLLGISIESEIVDESCEKENTDLKRKLEIAKNALRAINVSDSVISGNWVSAYHLRDISRAALKELESDGE